MVFMSMEALRIDLLNAGGTARALAFFAYAGEDEVALRQGLESGRWQVLLAHENGADIGGLYLNAAPKYALYQRLKVPELQDLRVAPGHRRKGVGQALVEAAENLARGAGAPGIGVSVGLTAPYGAAQRLYMRMGYIPDGNGVTFERRPVEHGEKQTIGDDLALMLIKLF